MHLPCTCGCTLFIISHISSGSLSENNQNLNQQQITAMPVNGECLYYHRARWWRQAEETKFRFLERNQIRNSSWRQRDTATEKLYAMPVMKKCGRNLLGCEEIQNSKSETKRQWKVTSWISKMGPSFMLKGEQFPAVSGNCKNMNERTQKIQTWSHNFFLFSINIQDTTHLFQIPCEQRLKCTSFFILCIFIISY
jgi:hypothetical protein